MKCSNLPHHHKRTYVHGIGAAATVYLEGLRKCFRGTLRYELVDCVCLRIIRVIVLEVLFLSRDRIVGVCHVDMPMQNMDSIRTSCHNSVDDWVLR